MSRAPRLRADERIAPYVTRVGRFRAIDPSKGRPLPPLHRLLAVVAWAAFGVQVARRTAALRRART